MKKIYYFIATAIVACAIFIGTISNGRASSIVDELQKAIWIY